MKELNQLKDGECLYCQLEKGDKVYARFGYQKDYCDRHRAKLKTDWEDTLNNIDDLIDIDREQDQIYEEIEEQNRKRFRGNYITRLPGND